MNQHQPPGGPGAPHGNAPPPGYGYPPPAHRHPSQQKSEMGAGRIALNIIGGVILLCLAGVGLLAILGRGNSGDGHGGLGGNIESAVRGPELIVDEEIVISAHGHQARPFILSSSRPVQVVADGKADTGKGFKVYVMSANEYANFAKDEAFRHVPSFHGLNVRSFHKTDTLPAGSWYLVVQNSENIINSMVVQIRVVTDPG